MAELNHRVKNTLAVVHSIATQTLRRSASLETFQESFEQRLHAIATAHSLLTKTEWEGAPLRDIIGSEVRPRLARDDQCSVSGPLVTLRPRAALALHMVIHELATNASKYGALQSEEGRISIEWDLVDTEDGPHVHLSWTEHCPHAVGEPAETGYGSRLIEQIIDYELQGQTGRAFRPDGFHCWIRFALLETIDSAAAIKPSSP
jgi:two-component sensor histidine kinase